MGDYGEESIGAEDLFGKHQFMRVPRDLPAGVHRVPEIGLNIRGHLLIYNDGREKYYWQKKPDSHDHCERIVREFEKLAVTIHR